MRKAVYPVIPNIELPQIDRDLSHIRIKSDRVQNVDTKQFQAGGKNYYYVRIYLDPPNIDDLKYIEFVEYELHPTFRNRFQVSDERHNKFMINIWTWGFFLIKAKLVLIDGNEVIIHGKVTW